MADLESVLKIPDGINADVMSDEQLHAKLQKGFDDIDAGGVHDAAAVFSSAEHGDSEEAKNLDGSLEEFGLEIKQNADSNNPSINPVTADRIRILRTHLKLRGCEFAELIGYSRSYVSMIEHCKLQANEKFLESVSVAIDVPMEWLMGGESDEEEIFARSLQHTEEARKLIRVRNQAEVRHHNGINAKDFENLTEEERIIHQEMMQARGKRLREVRKGHAHSIRQCGDIVPLSTSTVFQIESGKREMTKGVAKKLENAYDVSSKWLLYGDELSKDWPCGDKMIGFLEGHPEVRKYVWEKMMEEESGQELVEK